MDYTSYVPRLLLMVAFLICTAGAPAAEAQNLHDDHFRALPLYVDGTYTYEGGNAQPDEGPYGANASCVGVNDGRNTSWSAFRPQNNGQLTLDALGSTFDTILVLMTGDGTEIACNDDSGRADDVTSRLENISVTAGTLYLVRISGYQGAQGTVQLQVSSGGTLIHPFNERDGAVAILAFGEYFNWNLNAPFTSENTEFAASCANDSRRSVWYAFRIAGGTTLSFEITNTDFDTVMNVIDAIGNEVACDDDGGAGNASRITFTTTSDQQYWLRVSGFSGSQEEGFFYLNVSPGTNVDAEDAEQPPLTMELAPPYPNPFAHQTTLSYHLTEPGNVRLAVYDLLGREVALLVDGIKSTGTHTASFDATELPSGVYVARLEAHGVMRARTLALTR